MYEELLNILNVGLVILDEEMKVRKWNQWMERHSNIMSSDIEGKNLFDLFPTLKNQHFNRSIKSVLAFNSMVFYSQKLHRYCFPIPPISAFRNSYEFMQQNCTIGPLESPDGDKLIFISIQDVTNIVYYESQLREMNTRDALTGAYNRRFLDSVLGKEFKRHMRHNHPMSVLLFDIDHFKRVNDNYGHQCGDEILKLFSAVIQEQLRDIDFFARYGGEEFCCLLPETSPEDAFLVAERVRIAIEDAVYKFQDLELKITSSIGIGSLTPESQNVDELIEIADKGLYQAKEQGRNTVIAAQ
jgi:diguanylate cyclase (GGDEF)-like protein